jgi:hypothetical protein
LEEPPKASFKEVTEVVETIPSARRLTGTKQTDITPQNHAGTADTSSASPYQRQYNGRENMAEEGEHLIAIGVLGK